jgi:8-oxo-dGTP pyrophosphatase MutT (NUDIX family)
MPRNKLPQARAKRIVAKTVRRIGRLLGVIIVRQAGGIVYRFDKRDRLQVLLITSRRSRKRWVLPKGTIKRGEASSDAALREVREESGVRGKLGARVATVRFANRRESGTIEYFLIKFRSADAEPGEPRDLIWCSLKDALETVTNPSARRALVAAGPLLAEVVRSAKG